MSIISLVKEQIIMSRKYEPEFKRNIMGQFSRQKSKIFIMN
ncbi:hypothetical protein HMPREF1986_02288 [Oribacterium sp. oral taxon 078 str. F0263]|nr:hypothetical protein HMPREF1986_02288 [Oribacterium sp. oral taxon 078 str. F0263]